MDYVYILTNQTNNVMYIGVTNDLERRLYEHKHHLIEGFTRDYRVDKLVYFEKTWDVMAAIEQEKQLKKWRREKKNALVQLTTPCGGICLWTVSKRILRSSRRFAPQDDSVLM